MSYIPSAQNTLKPMQASNLRSPWMSGADSNESDSYLERYTQDFSGADLNSMDLSWLTQNHNQIFPFQPSYLSTIAPPTRTYTPPSYTLPQTHLPTYAKPLLDQSIDSLLASRTAYNCKEILEDPIRRKPGRKPKGTLAQPLPEAYLTHLALQEQDINMNAAGFGEDKKEERKFKNREAADQSRKRLKDRGRVLEEFTGALETENEGLRKYLRELEARKNSS